MKRPRALPGRKPRISLVQAPVFTGSGPSNALALLAGYLKRAGYEPRVHDASARILAPLAELMGWDPSVLLYDYCREFHRALERHSEFRRRALDEQAAAIMAGEPDVVGFSVLAGTEVDTLALAGRLKRLDPGVVVILGGPQCLRETLAFRLIREPSVDAVALGEADRSLAAFLEAFDLDKRAARRARGFLVKEDGQVVDCGDPEPVEDLDTLPYLDFSVFDMTSYRSNFLYLNSSRGCVRECAFCTHILEHKVYRTMTAERTASEIGHQLRLHPERNVVDFTDSLINGNVRRLGELADRLAGLRLERAVERQAYDLKWRGMAIIHDTMSAALLARMKRGGCLTLAYGLESGSQKVVDLMRKSFDVRQARAVLRRTKESGINVHLFLLVGYPGETDEDFRLTLDFIRDEAEWIDGVKISTCAIAMGSHLDRHREELGVVMDPEDRDGWRCRDGSSTPEIRRARYAELSAAAARFRFNDDDSRLRALLAGAAGRA